MSEVIRVNRVVRVNRGATRRVVLDSSSSLYSSLERFRALTNNPNNPENPPTSKPQLADPPTDAERWPLPPFAPESVTLAEDPPNLTREQGEALTTTVSPQPVPVIEWVCRLAERYDEARRDWPGHLCERAACIDLLLWQRRDRLADHPPAERLPRLLLSLGVDPNPPKTRTAPPRRVGRIVDVTDREPPPAW